MEAPKIIHELVEHFSRNPKEMLGLNETEVRVQFIDPFFEALGWDVHNRNRYAETYKDVIHEYSLRNARTVEAPDYKFQVGGLGKFYVEAKRPSVPITKDMSAAYQVRSYGWTSKLPIAILTNFSDLAIYDCRKRPSLQDKASLSRIDLFRYSDYIERWGDLYDRFSREAVYRGSFDRYESASRSKRGTADVDESFLEEIELWRASLAANIAKRNKGLRQRALNFAVQRTIDRLVFLRICEDRSIEQYGQLQNLSEGDDVYSRLRVLYERADEKYNSGLFHFTEERGRDEEPDSITPLLAIDDSVLRKIIKRLYYPESPYRFSHLPPDVLGQVYEQFLGKVIRITPSHQVKIDLKPEVRKAGGIYYTPSYVVGYIVKNTLSSVLTAQTPAAVAKLKILDPACGSGSFVIQVYQELLDWHRQWYLNDGPEKHGDVLLKVGVAEWKLTMQERRRILLNNIFGVDIDTQAVEVAKLSLLLKVLEGESEETVGRNLRLFHQRALPDLGNNLKCGNSLIANDYFKTRQLSLVDEEEVFRINAFDWASRGGFSTIMKSGGFDVILGNPPYLYSAAQEDPAYFGVKFKYSEYQTDYYVYFIEKSLDLLKSGGKLSFIVSDSWLNSERMSKVRKGLLSQKIDKIAVFDYPVFKGVTLENSIIFVQKGLKPAEIPIVRFESPRKYSVVNAINPESATERNLIDPRENVATQRLVRLMEESSSPLAQFVTVNRGLHAYRTDGYGQTAFGRGFQTQRDKDEESYHADKKLDDVYLPEIKGKQVHRYAYEESGRFVKYGPWLAEPRVPEYFYEHKIVLRKVLGRRLHGTFIPEPAAIDQSLYIGLARDGRDTTLKYVLAVLLSSVGAWYLRHKHAIFDSLYPWYTKRQLDGFPLKAVQTHLVKAVDDLTKLNVKVAESRTETQRSILRRQIEFLEESIDEHVFRMYRFSPGDIALVRSEL